MRFRSRRPARPLLLAAIGGLAITAVLGGAPVAVAGPVASRTAPTAASATPDGWIVRSGPGGPVATWTSTDPLPVGSARPEVVRRTAQGPSPLGPVTIGADGRSVSVPVPAGTDPADLDVVLSGRVLDTPSAGLRAAREPEASATPTPGPGPDLGVDPGKRGPYAVTSSDYSKPGLAFPGFESPIEVVGHVVRPTPGQGVTGKPLVLFLHGRHQPCYDPSDPEGFPDGWPCPAGSTPVPSQLGYDYAQRLLASQGYTSVSIAANGINAQDYAADDGGALARSALVQRHLDLWAARAVTGSQGVDLRRVVLVGHSRGGEGVDLASQQIGLGAPYRISGQLLLGPTDFARRTAAYVPTVTVLPYCDGDVSDLQGQLFTDTSRGLAPGDTALKSTVLVMGANHNFFNTEWTPGVAKAPSFDDWYDDGDATCGVGRATRLTAAQQRSVGAAYVAGAVDLFTQPPGQKRATLRMFDGTPGHVASTGKAVVYSHAVGGGRTLRLPDGSRPIAAQGASARLCRGVAGEEVPGACTTVGSERAPHWAPTYVPGLPTKDAVEVSWDEAGAVAGVALGRAWDLRRAATVDLRALADPDRGDATVRVRLGDATGRTVTLTPTNGGTVRALPGNPESGLAKLVAQQLRVPLAGVTGIDLSRITSVALVPSTSRGRVWVLDAAAVPDRLAPVKAARLPLLSLGEVEVPEGSATGTRTVEVPWRVSRRLTAPAAVSVLLYGADGEATSRTLRLPAGARAGSIDVAYQPNRVWTGDRTTSVQAFPVSGVGVADGNGSAVVIEDEPAPQATLTAVSPVREGGAVTATLTLDRPAGVDLYADAYFERPEQEPRLTVDDLPSSWVEEHLPVFEGEEASNDLWERYPLFDGTIPAGNRSVTFTVPVRQDGVEEGTELASLSVNLYELGFSQVATVGVQDY